MDSAKYLPTIRSGRESKGQRGSGKAREGGDVPSPLGPPGGTRLADPDPPTPAEPGEGRYPDRAQRRRGRKAPARPATLDRGGVSRATPDSRPSTLDPERSLEDA